MPRTIVYIDGFNLYYGAVKGTTYKWLDLARLCSLLLPTHSIQHINYFTALVHARSDDPQVAQRQQTYLRALATIPNLSIHLGPFLSNTKWMPIAHPIPQGPRFVEVISTEEKGSDVNLATNLLVDAFRGNFDTAVVISNDSDFTLPIELVRSNLGKQVGILNPQQNRSWALYNVTDFYRPIRNGPLGASQFPDILSDDQGTFSKPSAW